MTRRRAAIVAALAWSLTVALLVLGVALSVANARDSFGTFAFIPTAVTFATVGGIVAARLRSNPVGWLFCAFGLVIAFLNASYEYTVYALRTTGGDLPAGEWSAWLFVWILELSWAPLLFVFLLFPNGRLPSPRWRWLARFDVALVGFGTLTAILYPPNMENNFPFVETPVSLIPAHIARTLYEPYRILTLVALVASGAAVIVRLRFSRGIERQQLKWFTFSVAVALASFLVTGVGGAEPVLAAVFTFPLIPIAVGLAVLRYRLYEIDRLINRTLVYGALTALLAGVYLGTVVVLQSLVAGLGAESDLVVAASTLAVAALFSPLRRRIQAFIDHYFYRRKYDAARTVDEFAARLRDEVDLEGLRRDLVAVVHDTMQPAHVTLWIRTGSAEPQG